MRRLLCVSLVLVAPVLRAEPQNNTNVVTAAEDAFGTVLGPESLGLYNESSVRGFSPLVAGNVRVNGLYFDLQGMMTDRLADRTQIRVGLSATDFMSPAPTGIVDYTLRQLNDTRGLTAIAYAGPYGSDQLDIDGYQSLWAGRAAIAAGASYRHDVDIPGLTGQFTSFGILPQWTPNSDVTVRSFWGRASVRNQKTVTTLYLGAGQKAPDIPTRYLGQEWTNADYFSEHYGILVNAKFNSHWSLRAGLFRSEFDVQRGFGDIYVNTSSSGIGDHTLIAEPDQDYASTSGEVRISYEAMTQSWRQEFDLDVRARSVDARYGGAVAVDLGSESAGEVNPVNTPHFNFGSRTTDHIREYSPGASYNIHWKRKFSFTVGMQQPGYSRSVVDPTLGNSTTVVRPWLYNASLVLRPAKQLALFAALTKGLEDSGLAPVGALNSGEVLGAVRSSQEEVGFRYALGSSLALVIAGFDIQKPYFSLDARRVFTNLGRERHRGVEVSLAGEVFSGLSVVAGITVLSPQVIAAPAAEPIGTRAVGQPAQIAQVSVDYRLPHFPNLSLDSTITAQGARMVRVDNRAEVAGYSSLNAGVRYGRSVGHHSITLRIQVINATNTYNWNVAPDGGLNVLEGRRARAYFVVDF